VARSLNEQEPTKEDFAMSVVKEFKEFATRGNVLDLAIGIIIGGAFGKLVSSMVNDVLMPPIGVLIGGVDFSSFGLTLKEAVDKNPGAILKYGVFLNNIIDFTIVAFAVFLIVKAVNKMQRKQAPAPAPAATTKQCPECSMSIPVAAKRCGYCTSKL
jgi:large conductance mechanosensitive channel